MTIPITLDEPGLDIVSVVRPEGVYRVRVLGEAFDRIAILASGVIKTGDGATAPVAVAGAVDAVYTQAATVAVPLALGGTSIITMTSAVITGDEPPTQEEYNLLRADVGHLQDTVSYVIQDVAELHSKMTAILAALKGTGKPMASA